VPTIEPITKASVPRALEKAMRYRLLNEPVEAESICLDILAVDPANQDALTCMLLALTDQFIDSGAGRLLADAKRLLPELTGDYERAYYAGIIHERFAKRQIKHGLAGPDAGAYHSLIDAIRHFERARSLAPAGNDDATLRLNTCVRVIERNRLSAPEPDSRELPLE